MLLIYYMYKTEYKYLNKIVLFSIAMILAAVTFGQHSLVTFDYPINTEVYDEIAPVMSFDDDKIFYTKVGSPDFHRKLLIDSMDVYEIFDESEYTAALRKVYKQIAGKEVEDVTSSTFNQDIWVVHLDSAYKAVDLSHPGYPLNDALPNSICARLDDHGRFVLLNQFDQIGGLDKGFSVSKMKGDEFSFPEPVHLEDFSVTSSRVHLTTSPDQKVFILSLPNADGNMDLYVSFRLYDMHYSIPVPLESPVNTPFDEMTPFLSHDGKTLYFASNRPESRGGTDIFCLTRADDTYLRWQEGPALHPPVNTAYDEMYPCLFDNENKMLFTSNRRGSHDIFMATLERDKEITIEIEIFMVNAATKSLMPAELYWGAAYEKGKEKENYFRCRDGKYKMVIKENKPLVIKAVNRNYSSQEIIIDPQEIWQYEGGKVHLDLSMKTESSAQEVVQKSFTDILPFRQLLEKSSTAEETKQSAVFKHIMFEKSTANVLDRSLPTILTLGKFLKMNKEVRIEITGHTDNVGEEEALKNLSAERADAIKNILVKQGIQAERIITVGAGSSVPIADNSKESSRKLNRRVEIRILKEDLPETPSGNTF